MGGAGAAEARNLAVGRGIVDAQGRAVPVVEAEVRIGRGRAAGEPAAGDLDPDVVAHRACRHVDRPPVQVAARRDRAQADVRRRRDRPDVNGDHLVAAHDRGHAQFHAGLDVGHVRSHEAGGQDVAQHHERVLVHALRDVVEAVVRERDADVLGLGAVDEVAEAVIPGFR